MIDISAFGINYVQGLLFILLIIIHQAPLPKSICNPCCAFGCMLMECSYCMSSPKFTNNQASKSNKNIPDFPDIPCPDCCPHCHLKECIDPTICPEFLDGFMNQTNKGDFLIH